MRRLHKLLLLLTAGGASAPVNTVAPSISGTVTVGQTLTAGDGTWTGAPTSYTYQWKRGGVNIGSATNATYLLVDADFGYAITVAVTATNASGSTAATSAATALVQELPVQSLGSELAVNGNMETGSPPSNWSPLGTGTVLTAAADERTGGAGVQSLEITGGSTASPQAVQVIAATSGAYHEVGVWLKNVDTSGGIRPYVQNSGVLLTGNGATSWQRSVVIWRSPASTSYTVGIFLNGTQNGKKARLDDWTQKVITRNAQLIAPSANMRLTSLYTLPVSPAVDEQLWIIARSPDADGLTSGNYLLALLLYTGTQWNLTAHVVTTHTRGAAIITANSIGATNGLAFILNGNNISMESTANGGANWTARGTPATNSANNTSTGVNTLYTSAFTPGTLGYADPN